jgi:hypothetical protein
MKGTTLNKLTRAVTMGGFGLLAALASVGPAQAATPATPKPAAPESKSTAGHTARWNLDDQIVGYYRTLGQCELAGQYGERAGSWEDHDCSPVRIGLRRGAWALSVDDDDDWDRIGFDVPFRAIGGFPTRFRPVWPGQFRAGHHRAPFGRPGHFGPGHPRPGVWGPGRPGNWGPGRPGNWGPGQSRPGHFDPRPGQGGPRPGQGGPRPGQGGPGHPQGPGNNGPQGPGNNGPHGPGGPQAPGNNGPHGPQGPQGPRGGR